MSDGEKRAYHSPLRERQAKNTLASILEAAAELIVDEGLENFSMLAVADRASVSERTVYHHFPNQQALLDGFTNWVDQQLPGAPASNRSP